MDFVFKSKIYGSLDFDWAAIWCIWN